MTTRNGCQSPTTHVIIKLGLGWYRHSVWGPTYRRATKEVSKVVNLDWINNQACSLSQNNQACRLSQNIFQSFYNEQLSSWNDKENHIYQLFFWIFTPSRHKIQV